MENNNFEEDRQNEPEIVESEKKDNLQASGGTPAPNKVKEFISWIAPYLIAIIVVLLLKTFVFILASIPSGSMIETLMLEDKVYGNRLAYKNSTPERGDIVIFYAPDEDNVLYIKRVIGLPGEKLVIRDSKVYINDSEEPLREDYLPEAWRVRNDGYEFNIPEDSYFMMGDNRNGSHDARSWDNTYVTMEDIVARAEFVYWPIRDWKTLRGYEY